MITKKNSLATLFLPLAALLILLSFAMRAHAQNVQVDLSSTSALCGGAECFNAPGIYNDGVVYFGESYMDGGTECTPPAGFTLCPAAYGAQQLFGSTYDPSSTSPFSLTITNVPFTFGLVNTVTCGASGEPACIPNVVNFTTSGETITLPAAQQAVYSSMIMLGTAVNGHHAALVKITYTSGSPTVINQTLSDWCGFGANPNESIGVGGFDRIVANGTTIGPDCNLYAYSYSLDFTRTLQSITLTDNDGSGDSFAFAITLKPPSYTINGGIANPTSVPAGSTSTATVTVDPQPGYTGTVNLSCSISPQIVGDPPAAATAPSCSLSPTSVTVTAGESAPPATTLTFTAAQPSSAMARRPRGIFYAFWLPVPGLVLLGFGLRNSRRKILLSLLALGMVLASLAVTPACVSTVHQGNVGTPPGQYTVTVTGIDTNNLTQAGNAPGTTNTVVVTVTGN